MITIQLTVESTHNFTIISSQHAQNGENR
jgi:hypothetical protein